VNKEIWAREVRVIGPDGEQIGILSPKEALSKAEEMGFDLVEVAPTAQPPVCRIMDFGKYKYEENKKLHAMKSSQKNVQVKEVKLRPRTEKHDLEYKIRNLKRFLEEGNKAKVTVTFRGREQAYMGMGQSLLGKVASDIADVGVIEQPPRREGNNLTMLISPKS
jgi:translation initiation factor IF-3